jgi:hypothetical protein
MWVCGALAMVALAACGDPAPASTASAGPPPLLSRTDPATAADCPNGGSVVSTGLDGNGDGVLEDSEVARRSVVCTPAGAPPAPAIVIRLVAEPAGAHCAAGGTAVESGPDINGNGVLDASEVTHTEYACGQVLLTRIAVEPAGAHCSLGGVAFLAGRDRNGDGVLGDDEVETRSFECGDVIADDVTIASDADVAALADVRVITGTVLATFTSGIHAISLPKLVHAGGFRVRGSLLPTVSVPELEEVDGPFEINAASVNLLEAAQLRRVGSLIVVETGLHDLDGLTTLTAVDGALRIASNTALTSADLRGLAVTGDVTIEDNPKLTGLDVRLVGEVGAVQLSQNPGVTSIDLTAARIGAVEIFGDDALTHLGVSAARVDSLVVSFSPSVTDLALDVATVDTDVTVFDITAPFHLGMTAAGADHIAIGGELLVSSALAGFDLAVPLTVGDLAVFDRTQLTGFAPGNALTVGHIRFSANPQLASIAPLTLRANGTIQVIDNAQLRHLDFLTIADQRTGGMAITGNPVLVDAPALTGVTDVIGNVDIESNPALGSVFGPALTWIEGQLIVDANDQLAGLRFPALVHLESGIIDTNALLHTIEMPALTDMPDQLFIQANAQLRNLSFDALTHAELMAVTGNPHLPACQVDAIFAHVTGVVQQGSNDTAARCGP